MKRQLGDEYMQVLQTPLAYGIQKGQRDANNDESFPFCHRMSKSVCNISAAPNRNTVAVSVSEEKGMILIMR